MRLSARRLNRTLLLRQHLLERTHSTPHAMARHLVGLQAQENLPPYLSLAARLESFDPYAVSSALEDRSLVRLLTMRGTIHLLTAEDALTLRPWTQPRMEQELRSSQNVGPARAVGRAAYDAALRDVLADGPLPQKAIGLAVAERFPGQSATGLGNLARVAAPLVQVPPRGLWKQSGGVVYDFVDRWTGRPLVPAAEVDVPMIVRRYLAAFGPAGASDVTAWSGITRLATVLRKLPDLVRHEDADGKVLYDLPDAPLADEDTLAPVRLLGTYDNVFLAHAGRDRVTAPAERRAWIAVNGGVSCTLFVDGLLRGLWRVDAGRVVVLDLFRPLSRRGRSDLDDEITRVNELLSR